MKRLTAVLPLIGFLLTGFLLTGCIDALEPPEVTPMVNVTEGLVFTFGREDPCYDFGIKDGDARCYQKNAGSPGLSEPAIQMELKAFAIDRHEVTNAQYDHCVQMGHCIVPLFWNAQDPKQSSYYRDERFLDFPVVQIPWTDALAYCEFVGKRLPTQFEWERVARGNPDKGVGRAYPTDAVVLDINGDPLDLHGDVEACKNADIATLFCRQDETQDAEPEGLTVNVHVPGDDWVEEDGQKIHHLYGNVSEHVSDRWEENQWLTCKTPLSEIPEDTPGDCLLCTGCGELTGEERTSCDQNCKECPACKPDTGSTSGQSCVPQDRSQGCDSAYQTCTATGRCEGTLDCHYGCSGASRYYPVCEIYPPGQVLAPADLDITGSMRGLRGGNITSGEMATCRSRTDYRKLGTDPQEREAVQPYIGFRCAKSL